MKFLKKLIGKIKTSFTSERPSQKSISVNYKDDQRQSNHLNKSFLNEHNQMILKKYNKPIVKDLPERKRIFIEVRDVLNDIEAQLRNSEIDD